MSKFFYELPQSNGGGCPAPAYRTFPCVTSRKREHAVTKEASIFPWSMRLICVSTCAGSSRLRSCEANAILSIDPMSAAPTPCPDTSRCLRNPARVHSRNTLSQESSRGVERIAFATMASMSSIGVGFLRKKSIGDSAARSRRCLSSNAEMKMKGTSLESVYSRTNV